MPVLCAIEQLEVDSLAVADVAEIREGSIDQAVVCELGDDFRFGHEVLATGGGLIGLVGHGGSLRVATLSSYLVVLLSERRLDSFLEVLNRLLLVLLLL